MDIRFDGRRALVTGAGAGIGRGIVKSLVDCGAETYALSRTLAHLQSLKEEIPSVRIVQVDLKDWEQTRKAVENIGPIDLLVNNAAVLKWSPFLDVTPDDIDGVFDVNFKAVFNVSQVICKGMVERQTGGSVVNISSIVASKATKGIAAYSSCKAALDCLTRVMALELGPQKIQVFVDGVVSDHASHCNIKPPLFSLVNYLVRTTYERSSAHQIIKIWCARDNKDLIRVNSVKPTVVITEMMKPYPDGIAEVIKQTPLGKCAGIGRGIVKSLVDCGAETYALSRTLAHLQSLKEEIPSVRIVQVDLKDWEQTRKAVENIGPIDLLVNNAAVLKWSPFLDVTPDDIDGVFDVNFKAVFNVSQVICKGMVERQTGGSVVNISSIVASKATKGIAAYSSCKAALDCLTRVMALELGPQKIQVFVDGVVSDHASHCNIKPPLFSLVNYLVRTTYERSSAHQIIKIWCARDNKDLIRVNSVKPTVVITEMMKPYPDGIAEVIKQTPLGKCAEIQDVVDTVLFLLSDKAAMIHGTALPVDGGLLVH